MLILLKFLMHKNFNMSYIVNNQTKNTNLDDNCMTNANFHEAQIKSYATLHRFSSFSRKLSTFKSLCSTRHNNASSCNKTMCNKN